MAYGIVLRRRLADDLAEPTLGRLDVVKGGRDRGAVEGRRRRAPGLLRELEPSALVVEGAEGGGGPVRADQSSESIHRSPSSDERTKKIARSSAPIAIRTIGSGAAERSRRP